MTFYIKTDLEMLITTLKALLKYYQSQNEPQLYTLGQTTALKHILTLIDIYEENFTEHLNYLQNHPPTFEDSSYVSSSDINMLKNNYLRIVCLLNHKLNKTNFEDDENPPMQSEPTDEIEEAIKNSTRQLEPNESIQAPEMEIEKNRS